MQIEISDKYSVNYVSSSAIDDGKKKNFVCY